MLYYIGRGVWRGLMAGVLFSLAYTAFVIPLAGLMMILTNLPNGKAFEAVIGAGLFTTCAWPFSFLLGVLPGAILGTLGGLIAGCILAPWRNRFSPFVAAAIAMFLALLAVFAFHLSWGPGMLDVNQSGSLRYVPYLFWMLGPSIFAVPAAAWAGWSLQKDWLRRTEDANLGLS